MRDSSEGLLSKTDLSSMDRALDCKSKDAGSIPAGGNFFFGKYFY